MSHETYDPRDVFDIWMIDETHRSVSYDLYDWSEHEIYKTAIGPFHSLGKAVHQLEEIVAHWERMGYKRTKRYKRTKQDGEWRVEKSNHEIEYCLRHAPPAWTVP